MLRSLIIVGGVLLSLVGSVLLIYGFGGGVMCLIGGAVIVVGTLFEQVVYKRVGRGVPGPDWIRTTERFVDPQTGKTLTVYEEPKTGERAYIED